MNLNSMMQDSSRGFTLIELMVALVISATITTLAMTHLWTSRDLTAKHEAVLITEENARYTIDTLSSYLKMAGYPGSDPLIAGAQVNGVFYRDACGTEINCTADGVGHTADRFAIWLNPEVANRTACNGTDLSGIATPIQNDESVIHSFFVNTDANTGLNNLYCETFIVNSFGDSVRAFNNNTNAIIAGVENIQFLYGVYDPDIGRAPLQYLSADNVANDMWGRISSIKIAALVSSSINDGYGKRAIQDFQILNSPTYTPEPEDYCFANFCSVFSTTIFLENTGTGT